MAQVSANLFMSLIHAAELNGIAPFDHLVAVRRNPQIGCYEFH